MNNTKYYAYELHGCIMYHRLHQRYQKEYLGIRRSKLDKY